MNIQTILAYTRATECPICLDSLTLSTKHITICNHVFHETCLSQILGHTCPLCRHVISEPNLSTVTHQWGLPYDSDSELPLSPFTLQWGLQYDSESEE